MRSIIVLALLCPFFSFAQPGTVKKNSNRKTAASLTTLRPLTIGAVVPDLPLTNIINYPASAAKLSAFKSRLLILDFWATWCTACLKHFPDLESLQQQSNGRMNVLLVNSLSTGDNRQKAKAFFQKWKAPDGRSFSLPSLVEDTLLSSLFPRSTIPHYVWLDENLRVLAITGSEELTAANISAVLENRPLQVRTKADVLNYNADKPLLIAGNGGNGEALRFHTLISSYIQGLPTGTRKQQTPDGRYTKLTFTNRSVLGLYRIAFGNTFPSNRVFLEVPDTTRLTRSTEWGHWKYNNAYCYEILTPPTTREKALARMQSDLVEFFGYTAAVETRELDTWVLQDAGTPSRPSPKLLATEGVPERLTNLTLTDLIRELNFRLPLPVSNDCTGAQTLYLTLPVGLTDMEEINSRLLPYNLRFTLQKRPWPVFVIRGTDNSSQ